MTCGATSAAAVMGACLTLSYTLFPRIVLPSPVPAEVPGMVLAGFPDAPKGVLIAANVVSGCALP